MLSSLNIPRDGVSIMHVCDSNGNWQLEGILKSALTQKKKNPYDYMWKRLSTFGWLMCIVT